MLNNGAWTNQLDKHIQRFGFYHSPVATLTSRRMPYRPGCNRKHYLKNHPWKSSCLGTACETT